MNKQLRTIDDLMGELYKEFALFYPTRIGDTGIEAAKAQLKELLLEAEPERPDTNPSDIIKKYSHAQEYIVGYENGKAQAIKEYTDKILELFDE